MFWTILFHRKKKNSPEFPRQTAYNVPLELLYTAAPFVAVCVLFYFTVVVQNYVLEKDENPNVVVDVTGFQWNWKFGYRTVDMGGSVYDGADQVAEEATESEPFDPESGDHHAKPGPIHGVGVSDLSYLNYDKIETVGTTEEIPVLVLPTGNRIEFNLASSDVIHAFWVPEFLFKRDVNPNPLNNNSDPVFQISEIEREGAFVGRCAEMCGTYHAMMNFEVRAVSPEKFADYIELRKPVEDGGEGLTNAQALEAIGESPIAITTHPFKTDRTDRSASVAAGE